MQLDHHEWNKTPISQQFELLCTTKEFIKKWSEMHLDSDCSTGVSKRSLDMSSDSEEIIQPHKKSKLIPQDGIDISIEEGRNGIKCVMYAIQ